MSVIPGEERAWELIAGLSPDDICRRSGAAYDAASGLYRVTSYGRDFLLDAQARTLTAASADGELFLGRLSYFFKLSVLWYLVKAQDRPLKGDLASPKGLPGGEMFFKGSHVLPLPGVAKKYGNNREGFLERAALFGGRQIAYGDAAVELSAFPRIPTTVILWLADDEWEARCDLLFDASAPEHLPVDILWSIAMMSVLVFI